MNMATPTWLQSYYDSQQPSGVGQTQQDRAYELTMRSNPWVQTYGQGDFPGSIGPVSESSYVPRGPSASGGLVNLFTQQRRPPGGSAVLNYQQQQIANAQRAMQSQYQPQPQPQPQFQQPQPQYQPQFQPSQPQLPYRPQIMQPPTFQQGGGLVSMFNPNRQSLPGYRGYGSQQYRGVY